MPSPYLQEMPTFVHRKKQRYRATLWLSFACYVLLILPLFATSLAFPVAVEGLFAPPTPDSIRARWIALAIVSFAFLFLLPSGLYNKDIKTANGEFRLPFQASPSIMLGARRICLATIINCELIGPSRGSLPFLVVTLQNGDRLRFLAWRLDDNYSDAGGTSPVRWLIGRFPASASGGPPVLHQG